MSGKVRYLGDYVLKWITDMGSHWMVENKSRGTDHIFIPFEWMKFSLTRHPFRFILCKISSSPAICCKFFCAWRPKSGETPQHLKIATGTSLLVSPFPPRCPSQNALSNGKTPVSYCSATRKKPMFTMFQGPTSLRPLHRIAVLAAKVSKKQKYSLRK